MSLAEDIAKAINARSDNFGGWMARCPAHEDSTPSLSIAETEEGNVLLHCFAGCSFESVRDALRAQGVWRDNGRAHQPPVADLALQKRLPETLLRDNGFADDQWKDHPAIRIDYRGVDGDIIWTRYRGIGASNEPRFWCRKGDKPQLYGLWRLRADEPVILCEGETDTLALWDAGFNALGVPGCEAWRDDRYAAALASAPIIFVHVEPDAGGAKFRAAFERSRLRERVQFFSVAPEAKDPCELRAKRDGAAFRGLIEELLRSSAPPPSAEDDEPPLTRYPGDELTWAELMNKETPKRKWAIRQWVPLNCVTLLAGEGGVGKSQVVQAMASCLALQREYLEMPPKPLKCLAWMGEDDHDELWRRQVAIATLLAVPLDAFDGKLIMKSYAGKDIELAAPGVYENRQRLLATPMLLELREQIADFKADVVFLDNIARLFGGNENDRHQVTTFIASLASLTEIRDSAIVLLGHTAKVSGSEYSGSTAWESAARARLYLTHKLPSGSEPAEKDVEEDDSDVLWLCRRKANYSGRDYRRVRYLNGVMVPDPAPEEIRRSGPVTAEFAQEVVTRGVRRLVEMEEVVVAGPGSKNYLPKVLQRYDLAEGVSPRTLAEAMVTMQKDGRLIRGKVGKYGSGNARIGLRLADADHNLPLPHNQRGL